MIPIKVDSEKLVVTLYKQSGFTYADTEIFRMYKFVWNPDGSINIPIRGTSKLALWSTLNVLYPNVKNWDGFEEKAKEIKAAYTIFEQGFDKAVSAKVPLYSYLFAHQKECVRPQCYKKNNMLSLEQGLGKSISAIIPSMVLNTPLTIIVVPNSLKYNWLEEMSVTWKERFGYGVPKEQISIIDSKKGYMMAQDERYIIINYDIFGQYFDLLSQKSTDKTRLIIDECHYIKNRDAKRTKNLKAFVNKVRPYVSFLSGTPAPNTIVDIFSYLEITRHYEGDNYRHFLKKYCVFQKTQYGFKVSDTFNLDELRRNLQNFMVRKLKKDCLDLPDKNFIKITFENEKYDALYEAAYKQLLQKIAASNGKRSADIESQMSTLQVICSKAKVEPLIEWLENIMTQETETPDGKTYPKKIAVMCNFKEPIYMLQDHFKERCVLLDGSVASDKRMDLVNSFKKKDSVQLFLGQTTAAGVGLNMTECQDVIFLNFPYTRAEIDQASDRFHRIGQWGQVSVYFTVLAGKIDEYIFKLVRKKYRSVSKLIDSIEDETKTSVDVSVDEDLIGSLLSQLKLEVA